MIRVADPAKLGPALAQIRNLLGLSRHDLGRAVEANTGRPMLSVVKQVQQWDNGRHSPTATSLGPVLDALGYDLALIPREQPAPEPAECGCPVRYERARILSHTRSCSDREAAERLAAYIAREDTP